MFPWETLGRFWCYCHSHDLWMPSFHLLYVSLRFKFIQHHRTWQYPVIFFGSTNLMTSSCIKSRLLPCFPRLIFVTNTFPNCKITLHLPLNMSLQLQICPFSRKNAHGSKALMTSIRIKVIYSCRDTGNVELLRRIRIKNEVSRFCESFCGHRDDFFHSIEWSVSWRSVNMYVEGV